MELMMRQGMTAQIAAADVDPDALQEPPVARRPLSRPTVLFALVAVLAYLLGIVAFIPARALVAESDSLRVGGTIWTGQAVLASAIRIEWKWSPLATLTRLGFTADWHATGGSTDLAGTVTRRGGSYDLSQVSGQADGMLLDSLGLNLPLTCRFVADVAIDRLVLGGANQQVSGKLRSSPASCNGRALAASVELPAMQGEAVAGAQSSIGALSTVAGRVHLIELRLARDGNLSLWPTNAAVGVAPLLAGMRWDMKVE